jgi:hypothetical protein
VSVSSVRQETTELAYQQERAALYASGIGLARMALKNGDIDAAYDALTHYCDRVKDLTREWMRSNGHDDAAIAWFVGDNIGTPAGGAAR